MLNNVFNPKQTLDTKIDLPTCAVGQVISETSFLNKYPFAQKYS